MDRLQSIGVAGGDANSRSGIGLFISVRDLVFLLLHHISTGRHPIVDEHRDLEIPVSEHFRDVREVSTNLILIGHRR